MTARSSTGLNFPTRVSLTFLLFVPYLASIGMPEEFWGTHHWVFLPKPGQWLWAGIGMLLAVMAWIPRDKNPLERIRIGFPSTQKVFPWIVGLLYLLIINAFPMVIDSFGDARFNRTDMAVGLIGWDSRIWENLFYLNFFDPKIGSNTIIGISQVVAILGESSVLKAFLWVNTAAGAAFVGLWTWWIGKEVKSNGLAWSLWVMGLAAPFTQVFYRHAEFYPLSFLVLLGYGIVLVNAWHSGKKSNLIWVWGMTLLAAKLHITSLLLILPGILITLYKLLPASREFLKPGKFLLQLLLPIGIAGILLLALVVYPGYSGRTYTSDTLEEALVIPVVTSEPAPLDQYTLFSLAHIWDYLMLLFIWSAPAWLWILMGGLQKLTDPSPRFDLLRLLGLVLLTYMGAFFVLNPLLSMQIDWDLFSLPAVWVLILAVQLAKLWEKNSDQGYFGKWMTLAIVWMGAAVFWVNAHHQSMANRLESEARREFKTYWIGASTIFEDSFSLYPSADSSQQRRLKAIKDLRPFATPTEDLQYADLIMDAGIYVLNTTHDPGLALPYFQEAYSYMPTLSRNVYHLVVAHFMLGQYAEAHQYSKLLIGVRYPTYEKAYRMAIHVALEAEAYQDAEEFVGYFLELWPEDGFMARLYRDLQTGENLDQLKKRFQQGN